VQFENAFEDAGDFFAGVFGRAGSLPVLPAVLVAVPSALLVAVMAAPALMPLALMALVVSAAFVPASASAPAAARRTVAPFRIVVPLRVVMSMPRLGTFKGPLHGSVIVGDFLKAPVLQIGERQLLRLGLMGRLRFGRHFGLDGLPAAGRTAAGSFLRPVRLVGGEGRGFGSGRLRLGLAAAGFFGGLFFHGFIIVGQIFAKNRVQVLVLQIGAGFRSGGELSLDALGRRL
jgi:hypothetical protein